MNSFRFLITFLLLFLFACGLHGVRANAEPVKIIIDTDMMTDCDDAGAFAVLHALADNGECVILATMVSSKSAESVMAVSVLNTYYGRPGIPIGAVKGSGVEIKSLYTQHLANEFPHSLKTADDALDAVQLYRDVLEKQPDHSVVIATVGYLTNIKGLLQLPAEGTRVSGADLVKQKVRTWVCMGGNFIGNPPHDDLKLGNVNLQRDAASALFAIEQWPAPIIFVGREVASVPSHVEIGGSLAQTPPDNPVRAAYYYYFGGQFKNRHVADLATVLCAVRGAGVCWDLSGKGRMILRPDMSFDWEADASANQCYLLKRADENGRPNDQYVESILDKLLIQAPRKRTSGSH